MTLNAFHLGVIIYRACAVLVLVNVSAHTKFEVPSFTHFKDMIGSPKFKIVT